MKNRLIHFAIHTDDIERARDFYQKVFNWNFNSYGPKDFLQITTGEHDEEETIGALQSRRYSSLKDNIKGVEGTIHVEDVDSVLKTVRANGGQVVLPKTAIPQVGWITKFLDTEDNMLCALEMDPQAV